MTPEAFSVARRALTTQLIAALVLAFNRLGSWHRPDAERFVALAVPLVLGAQTALGMLVSNYIASRAMAALHVPVAPPVLLQRPGARLREGDPNTVYTRPFVDAWTALKNRETLEQALHGARVRMREIAEGDMQQAYSEAAHDAINGLPPDQQPSGWRRVLFGNENCALCVVASTQLYHRQKLNPIHPACDCRVEPWWGPDTHVIEPALLEQVHAAVTELTGTSDRGARAPDYRKILTQMTQEHGELGPMLARPLDHFDGPRDIPG